MGPDSPTHPPVPTAHRHNLHRVPPPVASTPQHNTRAPKVICACPLDSTTKTSPQSSPVATQLCGPLQVPCSRSCLVTKGSPPAVPSPMGLPKQRPVGLLNRRQVDLLAGADAAGSGAVNSAPFTAGNRGWVGEPGPILAEPFHGFLTNPFHGFMLAEAQSTGPGCGLPPVPGWCGAAPTRREAGR
ncbi:hypothetical protein GCM10022226_52160 [Sphaerisporangium flaviroseum]|uniref:Uncharacterized protein n=1 Tax=Sphaerisporangium flaviroseum TaxID=509199 RepID=A0ABP7IRM1_9ACTN